jgi:predicted phosphoribosyltransferase
LWLPEISEQRRFGCRCEHPISVERHPNVTVQTMFQDRGDAGRALAKALESLPDLRDAIVLGLPRGGVPVAYEVALGLRLPLDILVVRKLGAPGMEELAMGAIASGGIVVSNPSVVEQSGVSREVMDAAVEQQKTEIERRERVYRGGLPALPVEGRAVILVDDGMATGASMLAAVRALRPRVRRIIVAVPVAPESTYETLRSEVDQIICMTMPKSFFAVGQFYRNFDQTTDDEVRTLLLQVRDGVNKKNRESLR